MADYTPDTKYGNEPKKVEEKPVKKTTKKATAKKKAE